MNISISSHSRAMTRVQDEDVSLLSSRPAGEKPADITRVFNATERKFGEHFDCSTHAAVIKLMMATYGQHPVGMFNELTPSGDGFDITMKDDFKVHLSRQEMALAAQASRFNGEDRDALKDANFVFAAFVKRKQLSGGYPTFEAALAKTVEGETIQQCLQGVGVFGLSQFVSSSEMAEKGAMGLMGTHNRGADLVVDGMGHGYGQSRKVQPGYGYVLFDDKPVPRVDGRQVAHVAAVTRPEQIWSGFYQGVEGNCVTVSAIKAAITRFGQDPQGIYRQIQVTPDGFDVVMRDSFRVHLTHEELRQATAVSGFCGNDPQLLGCANFLFAVSAKRAQREDNDFRARQSYEVALQTLNDGEAPGEALRRLGLYGYIRESSVEELARGAVGTLANSHHSVAVIDGALDDYGQKRELASSRWMRAGLHALKLV